VLGLEEAIFMIQSVLIAEGDGELCAIYKKFLTERGYRVETARDGLDCLANLRRTTPAAVVLDLELRWGGGDGVLAWLREQQALAQLPVVLTATAGSTLAATDAIVPPVVQILPKPFTLMTLLDSVRAAIASTRPADRFAVDSPERHIG
jgi:two-component system response regulator AtoC